MNLLLLEDGDFVAPDRVRLQGRRLQHLREVHRAECGDSLRVGRLGGLMGRGELLSLNAEQAELQISLDTPPPAKLPLTLLLAVPRPKMLKRVLQTVSAMGVARLVLLNSYRVEKSFWQTPFLEPAAIREIAKEALELKTGARGLRTILERLMLDVMYEIPSCGDVCEVLVTKKSVRHEEKPRLKRKKKTTEKKVANA